MRTSYIYIHTYMHTYSVHTYSVHIYMCLLQSPLVILRLQYGSQEKHQHQTELLENRLNDELSTRALSLLFRRPRIKYDVTIMFFLFCFARLVLVRRFFKDAEFFESIHQ